MTIDDIVKPQRIDIKINSERQKPSLYIDGTATAIPLDKGDKIKLYKCETMFNIAFLDPKAFYKKE